uniref:C2H2-type domain-containing protein n=1 Tax=Panagrolaimus davidi TaxID=227884 RepID=A0A914PVI6_9BILA
MRKILDMCPAKRKVALESVDQFKADGVQAFGWLKNALEKMEVKSVIHKPVFVNYTKRLEEYEFFLKHDYYMLLQMNHHSADMCINYALSDPQIPEYKSDECNNKNDHLYKISRAFILKELVQDINANITHFQRDILENEKDVEIEDIKITIEESENAIQMWKNHIVRRWHSNMVRKDILENLENGDAMVTIDFGQKILPRKHTESQQDYFGKAGLSNHIMHTIYKNYGTLVQHTIITFTGYIDQDNVAVAAILLNGLKLLADKGVKNVIIRSDRAAYYHNPALIISMPKIAEAAGLTIKTYSYSEAQAGKSTADVETARLKGIIRDFLHSGNDVQTAEQMFNAIDRACKEGRVDGVTAVLAEELPASDQKQKLSLPDFQYLGEIEYFKYIDEGHAIWVYKHYKIGAGKVININSMISNLKVHQLQKVRYSTPTTLFWREKQIMFKNPKTAIIPAESSAAAANPPLQPAEESANKLHHCHVEGCRDTFLTEQNLQKHMLVGKHNILPVKETIDERAYSLFYDHVTGVKQTHDKFVHAVMALDDYTINENEVENMGWALKQASRRTKYTPEIQKFLNDQYVLFLTSGQRRVDAYIVQQRMRESRNPLFKANERLSAGKIASYFSSRQSKLKALAAKSSAAAADEAATQQRIREAVEQEQANDDAFDQQYQEDPIYFSEADDIISSIRTRSQPGSQPNEIVLPDEE